jgi:hypothetical protein
MFKSGASQAILYERHQLWVSVLSVLAERRQKVVLWIFTVVHNIPIVALVLTNLSEQLLIGGEGSLDDDEDRRIRHGDISDRCTYPLRSVVWVRDAWFQNARRSPGQKIENRSLTARA